MAVWQVDFHVVPRRALAAAPQPFTTAVLNDTPWWAGFTFPADYKRRLSVLESPAASSTAEQETWGGAEGNRIDVWSNDGRVSRVMVRVDVRRLDSRFGAALIVFLRAADALLVRRDGLVVESKINAYAAALRGSDAWRQANPQLAASALDEIGDDD